jgi:flavin reductase (DIM6/NTAB) family NADH-FMN oxidoreductase RutF
VLNVPGPELWKALERLAPLTGRCPVPETEAAQFRYEPDKFGASGLTSLDSEIVAPPRVLECPRQMEARVRHIWEISDAKLSAIGGVATVEVSVLRVHARQDIVVGDRYIDPGRWPPLIYNFRHYFGLGEELGRTFRAEISLPTCACIHAGTWLGPPSSLARTSRINKALCPTSTGAGPWFSKSAQRAGSLCTNTSPPR